ncbi:hypothetical protein QR680_006906 [Steinernema hermaphroditum]|uniref:G-protein coupled receptors family 1 profile domain-containing protein n=1 Tax=Steinernema hermaphroditum TaxID=289476 RepID=A0AA39HWV6_9BILA|nr:hypothetical protein QR680_006906 [Steinernema hermaphroditum]
MLCCYFYRWGYFDRVTFSLEAASLRLKARLTCLTIQSSFASRERKRSENQRKLDPSAMLVTSVRKTFYPIEPIEHPEPRVWSLPHSARRAVPCQLVCQKRSGAKKMNIAEKCQLVAIPLPNESFIYDILFDVHTFYRPIHTYLSIIMCVVGTLCNVCNIVVLTRKQMRTPVNMVLTAMACCDTVVLFSNLIYTTHYTFVAFADCHPRHWSYGWAMFLIAHAHLSLVGHSSSVWLSVMLGLIRFLTLENRKKSASNHRNIGLKHSYCAIAVVLVSVTIFNSPNFLTYRIVEMRLNETCDVTDDSLKFAPSYIPGVSDLALVVNCLVFRLAFWISGIVFKIVPSVCLAFFAYRLSKVLKEVKNNRMKLLKGSRVGNHSSTPASNGTLLVNNGTEVSHSYRGSSKSLHSNYRTNSVRIHNRTSDRTDRTTRMLIMIVVVNVVTETPQGIMAILSGILADQYRQFVYNRLGDILDLLSLCGACTTFIIYCTMSGQFRTEFRRVFIPSWCSSWLAKRLRAASHTSVLTKMTYLTTNHPSTCNDFNNVSERSITMTVVGSSTSVRKFYPNEGIGQSQSEDHPSAEVESPKKEYFSTPESTDESTELLEDVQV